MLSYIKKNDGVTVALLTASCYVAAYFFEAGYAHHFGIPAELISITLGNIISTSIFLFFATIIAFFACTFPYHIVDRFFGKKYYRHSVFNCAIVGGFCIIDYISLRRNHKKLNHYSGFCMDYFDLWVLFMD